MKHATLGFVGVGLLAVGCFMPLVHIGIAGDLNYFSNGKGDGIIVLALAAASLLALLIHRQRALWITGALAALTVGYTFTRMISAIGEIESKLANNPFRGLANPQMSYGWIVLAAGCALILFGAVRDKTEPPTTEATH